jgi:site-specific recombinase
VNIASIRLRPGDNLVLRRVVAALAREGTSHAARAPLEPLAALLDEIGRAARPAEAIRQIVLHLDEAPELAAQVRRYTARLVRTSNATAAFSDLGLLPSHGLAAELRERIVAKLLPSHRPPHDVVEILGAVLGSRRRTAWLEHVDVEDLLALGRVLTPDDALARATLTIQTLRAIELLSHRLAAADEDPDLHAFAPDALDHESPFLAQAEEVMRVTGAHRARLMQQPVDASALDDAHALVLLAQCRDQIARMERRVVITGATVRFTYEIERIRDLIQRLVLLLDALADVPARAWPARVALFRELVRAKLESEHVRPVLARGSHLVAREIVAQAGRTGEHYITRTAREYGKMWGAAAGAGVVVAMLAAFKVALARLGAPTLLEALLFSANYAFGFVLVQALGWTIATKQPAMTAATLAASLETARPKDTSSLVDTIVCLTRSQVAAILGNVLVALPCALLLSWGMASLTGAPVATTHEAEYLAKGIDPLSSGAWLYAAITGVWLALSGVVAGYVSNSVIARHVPARIAQSRPLRRRLGARGAERLARWSETRTGATAGSVLLGVLLGSTAALGQLVGLPIDIRHVSFSSANLGLALGTLGFEHVHLGRALLGIAGIGAINLFVSFTLSLALALRARGRTLRELPSLAQDLLRALRTEGLGWLLPVGRTAHLPTTEAVGTEPGRSPLVDAGR